MELARATSLGIGTGPAPIKRVGFLGRISSRDKLSGALIFII
jgi:hypothetical protein